MRNFDLKAEADMRLYSDRHAAELARRRREDTTPRGGPRIPAPGDGPRTTGAAASDDEE